MVSHHIQNLLSALQLQDLHAGAKTKKGRQVLKPSGRSPTRKKRDNKSFVPSVVGVLNKPGLLPQLLGNGFLWTISISCNLTDNKDSYRFLFQAQIEANSQLELKRE